MQFRLVTVILAFLSWGVVCFLSGCGDDGKKKPKVGNIPAMLKKAQGLTDPEQQAREFIKVALEQKKASDLAGTESSLNSAIDAAEKIEDHKTRANVLNTVADNQANKLDLKTEAKAVLKKVQSALAKIEDRETKLPILAKMAVTFGQIGNKEAASSYLKECETLAGEIDAVELKIGALLDVAVAHGKIESTADAQRLIDQSFELARGTEDKRKRSEALSEIGGKLSAMKKAEESKAAFAEAEQSAEEIENNESKAYAYVTLADKQIAAGQKSAGADTLKKALKIGDKIEDASVTTSLNERIAQLRTKAEK